MLGHDLDEDKLNKDIIRKQRRSQKTYGPRTINAGVALPRLKKHDAISEERAMQLHSSQPDLKGIGDHLQRIELLETPEVLVHCPR